MPSRTMTSVEPAVLPQVATLAAGGFIAGMAMLVRGLGGYRTADRIEDTGTSTISSLAVGEVRVSGTVEAAELTLVSPLQSVPCVYYRATIRESRDADDESGIFTEERAVGFRIRDATGDVRLFPRDARWDARLRFDEGTDPLGDEPPGLRLRTVDAVAAAEPDRDALIARLLTVRQPGIELDDVLGRSRGGRRTYRESRVEPGDTVTVLGRVVPFGDLTDPDAADRADGSGLATDDPEIAADLAAARAAGTLAGDAEEAWGNAAIAGFGIGRPVRAPELDPDAEVPGLADPEDARRFDRAFTIAPGTLVLAAAADAPLLIFHGSPGTAVVRHREQYPLGLLGAVVAIGSAMAFAVMLSGGFGR
jgi:hypothetical protein